MRRNENKSSIRQCCHDFIDCVDIWVEIWLVNNLVDCFLIQYSFHLTTYKRKIKKFCYLNIFTSSVVNEIWKFSINIFRHNHTLYDLCCHFVNQMYHKHLLLMILSHEKILSFAGHVISNKWRPPPHCIKSSLLSGLLQHANHLLAAGFPLSLFWLSNRNLNWIFNFLCHCHFASEIMGVGGTVGRHLSVTVEKPIWSFSLWYKCTKGNWICWPCSKKMKIIFPLCAKTITLWLLLLLWNKINYCNNCFLFRILCWNINVFTCLRYIFNQ